MWTISDCFVSIDFNEKQLMVESVSICFALHGAIGFNDLRHMEWDRYEILIEEINRRNQKNGEGN